MDWRSDEVLFSFFILIGLVVINEDDLETYERGAERRTHKLGNRFQQIGVFREWFSQTRKRQPHWGHTLSNGCFWHLVIGFLVLNFSICFKLWFFSHPNINKCSRSKRHIIWFDENFETFFFATRSSSCNRNRTPALMSNAWMQVSNRNETGLRLRAVIIIIIICLLLLSPPRRWWWRWGTSSTKFANFSCAG